MQTHGDLVMKMNRRQVLLVVVVFGLALVPVSALRAQNLLTNGGIEFEEDTFFHSVPDGWEMTEGPAVPYSAGPYPADYNESGVAPGSCVLNGYCYAVDAADYTIWRNNLGKTLAGDGYQLPNEIATLGTVSIADYNQWKLNYGAPHALSMAEPSNFHLLEGIWNMWFQPYNSTFTEDVTAIADNWAHLIQDVSGTPGMEYTMTGWALFENYFPGGVVNLNDGTGAMPGTAPFNDGPVSPTDTFFALEFLDSNGDVLPGSITDYELMANGQPVNPGGNPIWMQHTLVAVAPSGTVEVRVRASMINGILNPLPDPQSFEQSFFVDDFSLTAATPGNGGLAIVPEPASWALAAMSLGLFGFAGNRRVRQRTRVRCN
jgi:hypothetical protein